MPMSVRNMPEKKRKKRSRLAKRMFGTERLSVDISLRHCRGLPTVLPGF
jgi:hypothetical protein